jgi:ribonuclease J
MSLNSKVILEVLDTTGTKELYRYKEQFKFVPKKRGEGFKQAIGDEITSIRDIRVLDPYEKEAIGNLNVQLAPVDHSLPGASAFLIEGSEEKIVYT